MGKPKQTQTRFIRVSRIQSIKIKLMMFALAATVIPSLFLGGLSYLQNSKLLREKISHELRNAAVQASGKLDLWLKERFYDLRVFSNSYIVSENLARMLSKHSSDIETMAARDHIQAYLKSVGDKFSVYEELMLVDRSGKALVSNIDGPFASQLPVLWQERLKSDQPGDVVRHPDPYAGPKSMFIAEAVKTTEGRPLGILAAKIDLVAIRSILKQQTQGDIDELYLINADGRLLVSSNSPILQPHRMQTPTVLPRRLEEPTDYVDYQDTSVVGMGVPVASMGWVLVAQMDKEGAYEQIVLLRRVTLVAVGSLMLCIGLLAYLFGQALVRPVRRLSKGASRVASGDLEVDVPVSGRSEVSYLTQVFNHMVASLRQGREEISAANKALRETNEELQLLSITDGLTGLHNRKHIMDLFEREISRCKRYDRRLAVLMLDIDHFKGINDTYGHQTGDNVMVSVAQSLQASVRNGDYVGRYGGEEFLIILPKIGIQSAALTAERIRNNIGSKVHTCNRGKFTVTVSIGVSGFPLDGENAESILSRADDALYRAKYAGRNRVVVSEAEQSKAADKIHLLPVKGSGSMP